jgi:hypothetical protein
VIKTENMLPNKTGRSSVHRVRGIVHCVHPVGIA